MWDIWQEIERVNREYPTLVRDTFPLMGRKIPDNYRYIRRSELVYPIDNGFILDFLYSNEDGSVVVKARKYYETELELEAGIRSFKQQFNEALDKKETTRHEG